MEGLVRMKVQCNIKFKVVTPEYFYVTSFFFFSEVCPEENLDLPVRNLFDYKRSDYTILRVLRMRKREQLDKEDEITMIDLPPNTTSLCIESGYQTPKKNPSPILTQLVTD